MAAKKTTTKKSATKKVAAKNPEIEMVSYSIKMTIPTGQYANIQPEIVVKANNPEDAHKYIAPHMNKLWKEYFMISEKKEKVIEKPKMVPVANHIDRKDAVENQPTVEPVEETSPVSDVAMVKATQAIQSCKSKDALDLIIRQIGVSTKLTEQNKKDLLPLVEARSQEINGGN